MLENITEKANALVRRFISKRINYETKTTNIFK